MITNEDIVERLLAMHPHMAVHGDQICATAANEIRSLRTREREAQDRYKATEDELRETEAKLARAERRNVELEEALKPFAKAAEGILPSEDDAEIFDADYDFSFLQVGHFRAASRALQSQETDDGHRNLPYHHKAGGSND